MPLREPAIGMVGLSTSMGTSVSVSTDQFTQLMQTIESSQQQMDEKLLRFQEEVQQGQEDTAAKALKQVKYDRPYSFRQKGNEAHVLFNAKVNVSLAQARPRATSLTSRLVRLSPQPSVEPATVCKVVGPS